MKTLEELINDGVFEEIAYGQKQYHNKHILDKGDLPLISGKGTDNGCYGFYDITPTLTTPAVTMVSTGTVGEAFVQDVPCGVGDDCLTLKPQRAMSIEYLYYLTSMIRKQKWRYNFGRKITPNRIKKVRVLEPDEFHTDISYANMFRTLYPKRNETHQTPSRQLTEKPITEFFDLERGQFHALDKLDNGIYPTVSRTGWNNGVDGFYDIPDGAKIYPKLTITVSTVSGDAFLQITSFIATDNVLMCIPKRQFKLTTLLYVQSAINEVKWRYSYGRQCYKETFQKAKIYVPLKDNGELDEEYIESVVKNEPYWEAFKGLATTSRLNQQF